MTITLPSGKRIEANLDTITKLRAARWLPVAGPITIGYRGGTIRKVPDAVEAAGLGGIFGAATGALLGSPWTGRGTARAALLGAGLGALSSYGLYELGRLMKRRKEMRVKSHDFMLAIPVAGGFMHGYESRRKREPIGIGYTKALLALDPVSHPIGRSIRNVHEKVADLSDYRGVAPGVLAATGSSIIASLVHKRNLARALKDILVVAPLGAATGYGIQRAVEKELRGKKARKKSRKGSRI